MNIICKHDNESCSTCESELEEAVIHLEDERDRLEQEIVNEIIAREKAEVDFDREACRSTDLEERNAALEAVLREVRYYLWSTHRDMKEQDDRIIPLIDGILSGGVGVALFDVV